MYGFEKQNEDDRCLIEDIENDALESFFKGDNKSDLLIHNVIKDGNDMGYLVEDDANKISYYKRTPQCFIPNNLTLNNNGKIIDFDIRGEREYLDNPDNNEVNIIIKDENDNLEKVYSLGFSQITGENNLYTFCYAITDYIKNKYYSFYFRQSKIDGGLDKRNLIIPAMLKEPICYCYQKNLNSHKYTGFQIMPIDYSNDPLFVYFLGVLNVSNSLSEFFYNWNYYKKDKLVNFVKCHINKDGEIVESLPFVKLLNRDDYLADVNSLNEKFKVPESLVNLYNRNDEHLNDLQTMITDYQRTLKLHK